MKTSEFDSRLREPAVLAPPPDVACGLQTTRVAVAGATGDAGAELVRILELHPRVHVAAAFSTERFSLQAILHARPEIAFLATPNEVSADAVPQLVDAGIRVIDLSGAFRLGEPSLYPSWYGFEHAHPKLLREAVYGLPEWCNGNLKKARLVANPGAYSTSVLLALRPITYLIDREQPLLVDAKSGVCDDGQSAEAAYSFGGPFANMKAFEIGRHRHEPEVRQELHLGQRAVLVFVPHLMPAVRGIYSTMVVGFTRAVTAEEVSQTYTEAYAGRPFVRVLPAGTVPELKSVVNTLFAEIGFTLLQGGRRAVVVSVMDNPLKRAASQAVQNFNLMSGYDESEGLL